MEQDISFMRLDAAQWAKTSRPVADLTCGVTEKGSISQEALAYPNEDRSFQAESNSMCWSFGYMRRDLSNKHFMDMKRQGLNASGQGSSSLDTY